MNIDLVFDTKTMNKARFLKNNSSLAYKKAYTKEDPFNLLHNIAVLDLVIRANRTFVDIGAMNLALGGKEMKIGRSIDNTSSLLCDEVVFQIR